MNKNTASSGISLSVNRLRQFPSITYIDRWIKKSFDVQPHQYKVKENISSMYWKNLVNRSICCKFLSVPENLFKVRQKVKNILITAHELQKGDFYTATDITHLPKKLALKQRVNYQHAFNNQMIAQTITLAHQRDESFHPITQAVQAILKKSEQRFSCLVILASGSGHLASHLASVLDAQQRAQINHTLYGVDISSTMSKQSRQNFINHYTGIPTRLEYCAVTADCTSWANLSDSIPELIGDAPVLTISHGGARYFAQHKETELLETLAKFPTDSRTIITEVGTELYQLIYHLADKAKTSKLLNVYRCSDQKDVDHYACWNLTYYYYLLEQYMHSSVFHTFIDSLLNPNCHLCTHSHDMHYTDSIVGVQNTLSCINLIFLEIAGARKQPIHLLELCNQYSPAKPEVLCCEPLKAA